MVASDAVERTLPTRIVSSCACAAVRAQRRRAHEVIVLRSLTAVFRSYSTVGLAPILFPAERSESRDPGAPQSTRNTWHWVPALGLRPRPGHEGKAPTG